jgi:hypothetical protein
MMDAIFPAHFGDRAAQAGVMRTIVSVAALFAFIATMSLGGSHSHRAIAAGGSTLARPEDPVVLTGADVSGLIGIATNRLVAFRYDGGWVQIPVQVDERDTKTFTTVYNGAFTSSVTNLFYTDTNTWTGADSDPTLDANDEIAFMSNDAGGQPPSFSQPANTIAMSGRKLEITDPLNPSQQGWVYLYESDGSLDPGAGASYVSYTFSLNSGNYKATYKLGSNMFPTGNPENSTVASPNYSYHFGDRWQDDAMQLAVGGATNVDILDRHKALFAPGVCVRSEDTFDGYVSTSPIEGAFVANKSGPVRAIRSYVGANSGPLTQRDQIFYAQRQDIHTYLRVHSIPSVMDLLDFSPAASGMTYYNNLNTGGVTIDDVPDTITNGPIVWQMATGAQGTVVVSGQVATNISGFSYSSYYLDDSTPSGGTETQCTGDAFAYGMSGAYINTAIPCTDPRPEAGSCTNVLHSTNIDYYEPPSQSVTIAQPLHNRATTPLTFVVSAWVAPGDGDGDGCSDAEELGTNINLGGMRDPFNPYDFADVPTPALPMAGAARNGAVSLSDVGAALTWVGTTDGGGPNGNGRDYDNDSNTNTIDDGAEYDRTPAGAISGPPNGSVSLSDVGVILNQVGDNCTAPG